jgi:hypothetical protein
VWTAELIQLKSDGRYGACNYDPRYAVDTSCDIGVSDLTVFCFWQNVGTETRLIDVYVNNDKGLEHYTKMLAEKPYFYGEHFGPHDIENREFGSGTSRIEQARRRGLNWSKVPAIPKSDQIAMGSQLMKRLVVNSSPDLDTGEPVCAYAMEALGQYHFKYDEVKKISSQTPVHDWSSHFCDAYMLYAVAKAKDTGFSKPSEAQIKYRERESPRLGAIMARNNNRPTGLWG